MDSHEGIYKGTGARPWYAGELNSAGEPVASGPGAWAGEWFKTKKQAREYLELPQIERDLNR